MSSDNSSKRKRVSQACKPCGTRKVKCNGATPICDRCSLDGIKCFYAISKRNTRLTILNSLMPIEECSPESNSSLPRRESVAIENGSASSVPQQRGDAAHSLHNSELLDDSSRLFLAYFRYIHPIWPLLYKPLYDSLDHHEMLAAMPRSLVFAIFSIAVLIHHVELENEPLSKHDQAKRYFDQALFALTGSETSPGNALAGVKPSILHCQVYTILALQQHSIGAFSQAGIFCAIASSMAIDQSLYRTNSQDNHVDAQVKSRLWWTIYVLEKMLSTEMNRPVLLRAEEADTPYPSVDESDEFELYSDATHAGAIVEQRTRHILKSRTMSAFHTSIKIARIMESVCREVYSMAARHRIRQDRGSGETIRLRLLADLQAYEDEVEKSPLKLDRSGDVQSIPVTVTNYVFMWLTTILLNRPFIENWRSPHEHGSTVTAVLHPAELCLSSANEICSTLSIYTRYMDGLPCDMMYPIFVAANVLLRHWQQNGGTDTVIKTRLELCVKWLHGLGKNWRGAEERRQMLSDSIDSTYLDAQVQDQRVAEEAGSLFDEYTNFSSLAADDNFDLDYLQWVNSLDLYGCLGG